MTFTVIIPTLNEVSAIATTVQHTRQLGFDEVIVVDGGSGDQTRAVVGSLATQVGHSTLSTLQLLNAPAGRARQMNAGAAGCRNDVLLFLHADTRLPDTARQQLESALADDAVVGGRFDVRFDCSSLWARVISTFMNARSRITRVSTGDQAMFVRRSVFEQLQGFSNIPIMEDIEFSSRLKKLGPTAALRGPVTTSFRRWSQQGSGRTILLMWALRFLYWIGVSPDRLKRFYAVVR